MGIRDRCKRGAMAGRSVCYNHGGASPVGAASPQFKNGRYSKFLPERLRDRYQEAQRDPEILVLRDEVALADARLADLLTRVDAGESGALWKEVKGLGELLGTGVEFADLDVARAALAGLCPLYTSAAARGRARVDLGGCWYILQTKKISIQSAANG